MPSPEMAGETLSIQPTKFVAVKQEQQAGRPNMYTKDRKTTRIEIVKYTSSDARSTPTCIMYVSLHCIYKMFKNSM